MSDCGRVAYPKGANQYSLIMRFFYDFRIYDK
jgi:hypothetical protein